MACKELLAGHDIRCISVDRKYYQQVVLVNLDDVDEVGYDINDTHHSIIFNLKSGATGYKYIGNDISSLYNASFSKSTRKGQPVYTHNISLPVIGVKVASKLVLKELDLANYFAAVQFRDGTIEIYGFENGLKTNDYTYEAQNGLGGTGIELSSRYPEDDIPYVYFGGVDNFNNDFADIGTLLGGDYSSDFSDDFYIVEL